MRLALCLILFAVFSACGTAPKVNYCIPASPQYGCSSGSLDKAKASGWVCLNTQDNSSLIKACRLGTGVPKDLVVCMVLEGGDELGCSNEKVVPAYGSGNYACLSTADVDHLLIWCKRNKKKS